MSVTKEQIKAVMYEETNRLAINILKDAYKEAIEALNEMVGLFDRIHGKAAIGRPIRYKAKTVVDKYPEDV